MMIKWREEHQTCENDEGVAIDRRIARPRQWVHAIVEPGKIFLAFEYLWISLAVWKHKMDFYEYF